MPATESSRSLLAKRRPSPLQIPEHPRVVRRRRLEAFLELFSDARRKPPVIYELQRAEPRVTTLPDDRQREIIHDGIRAGLIPRERMIRYRAQQLLDDLAQYPDETSASGAPSEALYVRLMTETAEAVEAQTLAHAMPTEANRERAVRETQESAAIAELQCRVLEMTPRTFPVPMGVR